MGKSVKSMSRVLIGDPDTGFLQNIHSYLLSFGVNAATFSDGRSLVEFTRKQQPSIVIVNTLLPILNGLDVIDSISAQQAEPVVFVALIGDNSLERQAELVKRQVLCSLLCPPDFQDIKNIILKIGY